MTSRYCFIYVQCYVIETQLNITGEMPMTCPTLYEYFWDVEQKKWMPWSLLVPKYIHEPSRKFSEILVPTIDTIRSTWLLQLMVRIRRPVVLVGETGTSKTATTQAFLRTLDAESHVSSELLLLYSVN